MGLVLTRVFFFSWLNGTLPKSSSRPLNLTSYLWVHVDFWLCFVSFHWQKTRNIKIWEIGILENHCNEISTSRKFLQQIIIPIVYLTLEMTDDKTISTRGPIARLLWSVQPFYMVFMSWQRCSEHLHFHDNLASAALRRCDMVKRSRTNKQRSGPWVDNCYSWFPSSSEFQWGLCLHQSVIEPHKLCGVLDKKWWKVSQKGCGHECGYFCTSSSSSLTFVSIRSLWGDKLPMIGTVN